MSRLDILGCSHENSGDVVDFVDVIDFVDVDSSD